VSPGIPGLKTQISGIDGVTLEVSAGCGNKKSALRKMHYCRSGSKLSCQIFRCCSL